MTQAKMPMLPTSRWTPPGDPIFGLTAAFREDTRRERINLGVGAYRDAEGDPYVFGSVRAAERQLIEQKLDKEYLPILGPSFFREEISRLIWGGLFEDASLGKRIVTLATPGGTAALRLGGEWIALGQKRAVYLSDPTWVNHDKIMQRAGLSTQTYPYFSKEKGVQFAALLESVEKMPAGSVVLLQASCHNPTGASPSAEQWQTLAARMLEKKLIPFFDLAYQGIGAGIDDDAYSVRVFLEQGHTMLVAYSCSKNFGLYGERTGALCVVTQDKEAASLSKKQLQALARASYSNPPLHGLRIVLHILASEELRSQWTQELSAIRERIQQMRKALIAGLRAHGFPANCERITEQTGMFSYGLISSEEAKLLRREHAVYVPDDGRINVAGLCPGNLDRVIEALSAVAARR